MVLEYLPFPTMADIVEPPHVEILTALISSVSAGATTTDKNKGPISCELLLIMDKCNIKTKDLLNFRLVSKSWRDAATTILLKRDACHITLRKQRLRITSREDPNYKTYAMYNFRYNITHKILDDLTSLMSTSSQFPVSNFSILGHRSRNNKFSRFNDHSELHRFLSLHGTQVKTLRLEKSVTMQELDLYSKYLRNLECIELDEAFLCKSKRDQQTHANPDTSDAIGPFQFQSITTLRIIDLGRHKHINNTEIIKLLLNSASQLKCIENFNLKSLQVILENGKGHLIQEFTFNYNTEMYYSSTEKVLRTMQKFSQVCSTPDWRSGLSKMNLDVVDMEKEACIEILHSISEIIRNCKDTLEELEITYVPEVVFKKPIIIPKMQNLKYLSLNLTDFCGRDADENAQAFQIETVPNPLEDDPSWRSLEAIFPKLFKVKLRLNDTRTNNKSNIFLHFFKMPLSENDATVETIVKRSFIPSVQVLETNFVCLNLTDAEAISALFPNVKFLKNRLDAFYMFQNNLWAMCPLATSIEICGIYWNTNHGDKFQIKFFDQFLTGFPFEICEKMRNFEKEPPLPDFFNQCELLTFLKMMPSICDMPNLQKLTLKFEELSSQFGSQLSAVYALQKIPHIKIIASYDPVRIDAGGGPDQNPVAVGDGYLASIAPYVQIVHEEQ